MTQKILFIFILLLVAVMGMPERAGAAYNDVSLTSDAVINVNGLNIGVSSDSATVIESITVNASDFSVTLQSGSTFYATSSDRATFGGALPGGITAQRSCSSTESGISLTGTGGTTVTIEPTSALCSATPSTSSSGSSSSGGGGIVGLFGIVNTQTTPEPTLAQTVVAQTPASTHAAPVSAIFTKTIGFGSQNDDVVRLQRLLFADPGLYPEGLVTGYFGPATQRAVGRFQEKYGVANPGDAGYGTVGPKTRAKLQEAYGGAASGQTPSSSGTQAGGVSAVFTKPLGIGKNDPQVLVLQKFLNGDPDTVVAASGAGALGNETSYFGSATAKAVGKFQEKYGIANPGDAGYGTLGPKTRAKLNELMK